MQKLYSFRGAIPFFVVIFLNSFVDLGHKNIIANTIIKAYEGNTQIVLTAIINGLILLPYILLFSPAGFTSDKYPKNQVMRASGWAAVFITLGITLCYYLGQFEIAFAMTFLMAVQSAFYNPAKYGYIKQLFGKERLAQANGIAQASAIVGILLGGVVFSLFFELSYPANNTDTGEIISVMAPIGWLLVANAIIELILIYRLPTLEEKQEDMTFDTARFASGKLTFDDLKPLKNRESIRLAIIGLAMFWSIGQVIIAVFPAYAEDNLGITNTIALNGIPAFAAIGIALGSYLVGRISKDHIEIGLIPISTVGITLGLWMIPHLDTATSHALNYLFIGTMGGMFIVPLNALIQFQAGEHELGKVLAANNWVQNLAMLSFLILTAVVTLFGTDSYFMLGVIAVVATVGGIYTVYKLPQSLLRFLIGHVLSRRYKIQVQGLKNIPPKGGVLLLGNHISWIDWAIVQIACPRTVHFVMAASIYNKWYLKWFFNLVGCIPISQGASSRQSLEQVGDLLNNGHVVCLFPEGAISRNGHLNVFRQGYERACEHVEDNVVILPFYLRGLWGSQFSRSSEWLKKSRAKKSQRDLIVAFGQPMPKDTSADVLKRRVFDLSITSWQQYVNELPSLGDAWINSVKINRQNFAIAEASGEPMTAKNLLVGTLCFARRIRQLSPEKNVGILLPTSTAGVIVNMATLLSGKVVVNLNYSSGVEAMSSAIEQAEIRTIYTSSKFLKKLESKGIDYSECFGNVKLVALEELKQEIGKTEMAIQWLATTLLPAFVLKNLYCHGHDSSKTAAILFSSGSEGAPKGIMLSHRNIMANSKQIADVLNTEQSDVVMASLPFFHAFGLTVTQFMPLIEGMPMVCHPDPTDALGIAKLAARYRATILFGTSTFLRLFIRNRKVHPLMFKSLRFVVAGAEKLRSDVRDEFKLKFQQDVLEGYGATETTPVASVNLPDSLDMNYWQVQKGGKLGTVGMPLPGTSFKIVDPNTFEELATNEEGMILIGGAQVMQGYLNNPEKTSEVIKELDGERWYVTGDKGRLDEDGFLSIVDRYSRFAKLGGEMVSLTQVEELVRQQLSAYLNENGEVDDSVEVIAINVPDAKKGEKIIILSDKPIDGSEMKQALIKAGCNNLMIPDRWFAVEVLPKLGSGKTDFTRAKEMAIELLES